MEIISQLDSSEAVDDVMIARSLARRTWQEYKTIWRVAFSAIICRVASYGTVVVTQAFIGHITDVDLAAYALVQTISIRFLNGILFGMSSATETLCGQAFGANKNHMLGIYLQRSWIINLITTTMMVPFLALAEPFYRLLGQEEALAKQAGKISMWFIPFMYQVALSYGILSYLQTQMRNRIVGWIYVAVLVIHALLSWIFVSALNLGVSGAMGALNLSSWLAVAGLLVYILGGWCDDTWKGFSLETFSNLWPMVKLSVSSGVMLCLELWYMSVLVLVAGYMKDAVTAISAFSICLYIIQWLSMMNMGFLGATIARVSNELGRGDSKAAKFSIKVILVTASSFGVIFCIIFLALGHKISYLFTSNEAVAKAVSSLSIFLAFSILLNTLYPILSGAAIGAGRQSLAAYINLCSYYLVGVPLGVLLAFLPGHLSIKGIWIGMMSGVATQTLLLGYVTWRTNWDDQVRQASDRIKKWSSKASETPHETISDQ